MICGFCGYEYEETDAKKGCGSCPGGCHNVHCPRCNYKNPRESAVLNSIKDYLKNKIGSGAPK